MGKRPEPFQLHSRDAYGPNEIRASDHYFITQAVNEMRDLDTGVHSGWARTGRSVLASLPNQGTTTTNPVCRFYGQPAAGLDSHFYSASVTECDEVAQKFPTAWLKESDRVFEVTCLTAYPANAPWGPPLCIGYGTNGRTATIATRLIPRFANR